MGASLLLTLIIFLSPADWISEFQAAVRAELVARRALDGAWRGPLGEDLTGLVLLALGVPAETKQPASWRHLRKLARRKAPVRNPLSAAGHTAALAARGEGAPEVWRAVVRAPDPRTAPAARAVAYLLLEEPPPRRLCAAAGLEAWALGLLVRGKLSAPPPEPRLTGDPFLDSLRVEAAMRLPPTERARWRTAFLAFLDSPKARPWRQHPTVWLALYVRMAARIQTRAPWISLEQSGGFAGTRETVLITWSGHRERKSPAGRRREELPAPFRDRLQALVQAVLALPGIRPGAETVLPGTLPAGQGADLRRFRLRIWPPRGAPAVVKGDDQSRLPGPVHALLTAVLGEE